MSLWQRVKVWLSAFWASDAGQVVQDAFRTFVHTVGQAVADALLKAAVNKAVDLQREYGPGTGSQKQQALNSFLVDLGMQLGVKLTGLFLEYLRGQAVMSPEVQRLKQEQAGGGVPNTAPEPAPA